MIGHVTGEEGVGFDRLRELLGTGNTAFVEGRGNAALVEGP